MTQLAMQRDDAAELEAIWTGLGPLEACRRLGVDLDSKRSKPREAFIRCPWHVEKTASCTVRIGNRGTLQFRCFGGCGRSWDIHAAVAQLNALDPAQDFRKVLELSAGLLGIRLDDAAPSAKPVARPRPASAPEPPRWPPQDEVQALWDACIPVTEDAEAWQWLTVDWLTEPLAYSIHSRNLARVLPRDFECPAWARVSSGATWAELGYRVLIPLYDQTGAMRSVRARPVGTHKLSAKVLPPLDFSPAGLVMADALAVECLKTGAVPEYSKATIGEFRCTITEGETDYLTRAVRVWCHGTDSPCAVFGLYSGGWTDAIANRIPTGSRISIETDNDPTGDKYAETIEASLGGRCFVWDRRGDERKLRRQGRA